MYRFIIVLLSFLFFFTSCDLNNDNEKSDNSIDGLYILDELNIGEWPQDEYTIEECIIKTDILYLNITYIGGCKNHNFGLVISSSFLESNPVQALSLLIHDANNDTCESIITEVISFNLSPLKEEYKQIYSVETGTIILNGLCGSGFDNGLNYSF